LFFDLLFFVFFSFFSLSALLFSMKTGISSVVSSSGSGGMSSFLPS